MTIQKRSKKVANRPEIFYKLVILFAVILSMGGSAFGQVKLGYVNSQLILEKFKDATDAQKQLAEINKAWETEARNMQQELQTKQEALEAQRLVLTETKRQEKEAELQNLYLKFQQFQQEKWGQQGEAQKKQAELMKPVIDKVNEAIRKVGDAQKFDYIFDTVAGNILHISASQPDLTDAVLKVLNTP